MEFWDDLRRLGFIPADIVGKRFTENLVGRTWTDDPADEDVCKLFHLCSLSTCKVERYQ